jgi:hypothetical protein
MLSSRKFVVPILAVSLITLALAGTGNHQKKEAGSEILERKVGLGNLKGITRTDALTRALSSAHVPGGLVNIQNCDQIIKHTLTPSGPLLRDALDAVVAAEPQYKWQLETGVVNVVPAAGGPTLLDLRLNHFKVDDAPVIDSALQVLLAMPEVKARVAELKLGHGMNQLGIMPNQPESLHLSIDRKDITVREALNSIVRAQGYAVWAYRERYCQGQKEFAIDFLVR